jgi:hypothetical protein
MSAADKSKLDAITGSHTGTNTGDVTIGTANGLSLTGQALSLAAADGSNAGALTAGTQTIGGSKTFSSSVTVSGSVFAGTLQNNSSSVPIGVGSNVSNAASRIAVQLYAFNTLSSAGARVISIQNPINTEVASFAWSGALAIGKLSTTSINGLSGADLREGTLVWDSTLHKLKVYTGTAWETVTSS